MRHFLALFACALCSAQTVRFQTSLGNIDVNMLPNEAPGTVANFLRYVNRGAYNGTFIHRLVRSSLVQGGGYTWAADATAPVKITADAAIRNEFKVSNTRGTIAMAKLSTGPDTAANEWFFNLRDTNAANFDTQNGGFTVFGRVANAASLDVMDRISFLATADAGGGLGLTTVPLLDSTAKIGPTNVVLVNSVSVIQYPGINAGGVITGSNYGGAALAAPGSYIELYGVALAGEPGRAWASSDFDGGNAPTTLEGVTVTVGGRNAFVNFVSPGQVNVQVPGNVPVDTTVSVVLSRNGVASSPVTLAIRARAPGLLAPASLREGGRQFVAAFRPNGEAVTTANPARPGETLLFFGTGFGAVNGGNIAGVIAQGPAPINAPVDFRFGGAPGAMVYAGLAPGQVGLYQFNVTLPATLPAGATPLAVTVEGNALPQTLFLATRN